MFSKFREPINGLTHLFAACLAAIGVSALLLTGHYMVSTGFSIALYGLSQVLMFGSSAVYHLARTSPDKLKRLRKLDHSAIYLTIAGTYTPICLHFFSGFWQWGMLSIVWTLAIAGVLFSLVYIHAPRWLSTAIYLIMGWFAVAGIGEMLRTMPDAALWWLLAGGLFYSFGAIIYALKRPNFFNGKLGFHEIWHVFVMCGAFCHFMVIALYIAPYS